MAKCPQQFSLIPSEGQYFFAVINMVIGFIAFIGNLFVFVVISRTRSLRNKSSCSLLSLAITDFLVGVILEPMHILQFFFQDFRENCLFNSIRRVLFAVLVGVSISSIALISYDRYTHLSKAQHYNKSMSRPKVVILLIIAWVIPLFIPFLRLMGKDERAYGCFVFFYGLTSLLIILSCYICIIKIVAEKERQAVRSRNHIRAAKVVLIITISFFVASTPIAIYMGMSGLQLLLSKEIPGFSGQKGEIFYAFALTSAMVNAAMNPLIYYARIPVFKSSLVKLLKDKIPCIFKSGETDNTVDVAGFISQTLEVEV